MQDHFPTDEAVEACWCSPPRSLARWHELVHQMMAWMDSPALPKNWNYHSPKEFPEYAKVWQTYDAWENRIDLAWHQAPLRDRLRVHCAVVRRGWTSFKEAMTEAREEGRREKRGA